MTLGTTTNKTTQVGNGATTVWNYGFIIPISSQAVVITTDLSGNETILLSGQYSITGINNPAGGTVTYPLSGSPLAAGWKITIVRVVSLTQPFDIVNQAGFYPQTIEQMGDYIVMMAQQINELASRSIRAADSGVALTELPYTRALKYLAFDASGNPIAADPSSGSTPVSVAMAPVVAAATLAAARTAMGIASWAATASLASGDIIGNATGAPGSPAPAQISNYLDLLGVDYGSILFRYSTSWQALAPGTAGRFLQTQGIGANPVWAAVPATPGYYSGLVVLATSATTVQIVADVCVPYVSTATQVALGVNVTCNIGNSGANGLDTGTVANNTWYSIWVISTPAGTVASLFSTSATAPTMPSPYIYKRRMGWCYTNGSAQINTFLQRGNKVQYNPPRVMTVTTGTFPQTLSVIPFAPVTAESIKVNIGGSSGNPTSLAPNTGYVAALGASQPLSWVYQAAGSLGHVETVEMLLESTNIYYAMGASGSVNCIGYNDNL